MNFTKVMIIGRQRLYLDVSSMQAVFSAFGITESKEKLEAIFSDQKGYAEPFFKRLGAIETGSIDASSYEGALECVGYEPTDRGKYEAQIHRGF